MPHIHQLRETDLLRFVAAVLRHAGAGQHVYVLAPAGLSGDFLLVLHCSTLAQINAVHNTNMCFYESVEEMADFVEQFACASAAGQRTLAFYDVLRPDPALVYILHRLVRLQRAAVYLNEL